MLTLTILALVNTPLHAQTVKLNISGIKHGQGQFLIQIFQGESNYNQNKPYQAKAVNAKQNTLSVNFENVEAGEYAIRYFHDENSDGKLDKNLFGMPTEGYGFSNNPKINFGPPSFSDMAFIVDNKQSSTETHSSVTYF